MKTRFKMENVALFYLVIPLMAIIVILDYFFLKSFLKSKLPAQIESLLILNLFFNLPHIIASQLTLAKRDYIKAYLKEILIIFILCCSFIICFTIFFPERVLLWYSILTIVHVIGQQFGLSASLTKTPRYFYNIWKYIGIFLGIYQYLKIYNFDFPIEANLLNSLFLSLTIIFTVLGCVIFFHQKNKIGRQLSVGNWAMVVSPIMFMNAGYPILTSFIPRFIHDLTAFYAYFIHNYNRRSGSILNEMKNTNDPWLMVLVFTVFLPIIIAAPITFGWLGAYGVLIMLMASLFHYGIEGYAWKKGYKPREFLNL